MEDDLEYALAQVTETEEPNPDIVLWAADELLRERSFSDVLSDLVGQGWPESEAEAAVELARVRTRRARGVVTRADVMGGLDARYRRSTSGMAAFCRSGGGPLGIIAFATGLRHALSAARHLSQLAHRNRPSNRPDQG